MNFKVDKKRKKLIAHNVAKEKISVRILILLEKVILFIAICGSIAYACGNLFMFMPGQFIVLKNDAKLQSNELVLLISAIIFVFFLFVWLFVRTLRKNIAGTKVIDHIEEQLLLQRHSIIYSYRTKNTSFPEQRILLKVHLDDITEVYLNKKTNKLTIVGTAVKEYAKIKKDVLSILDTEERDRIVLYDYFSPSLIETLEDHGICIQTDMVSENI